MEHINWQQHHGLPPGYEWRVIYTGLAQKVIRYFATRERAEQWARQVGVFNIATIEKTD